MKISYTVNSGCVIEQDVKGIKEGFQFLAAIEEVFGVKKCGNCGSPNVRPKFRTAQRRDNGKLCKYFSIACQDCHHEFKFGQKQEEGEPLFPKGWSPPHYKQDDDSPKQQNGPQYHNQGEDQDNGAGHYEPPPQSQHNDGIPW